MMMLLSFSIFRAIFLRITFVSPILVGVSDIIPNAITMERVASTIANAEEKVAEFITLGRNGKLETQPGKSLLQSFESRVRFLVFRVLGF